MDNAIYRRFFSVLVGTTLVSVLVVLIAQRWYSERSDLVDNISTQATIIGANASAALVFNDAKAATEMLSSLAGSPMVLEAALYQADGSRLASHQRQRQTATTSFGEQAPSAGIEYSLDEIRLTLPVRLHGKEIGRVSIRASQEYVYAEMRSFLFGFLVVALFATVLAYLATARLRGRIFAARNRLEQSRALLQQLLVHRDQLLEEEHRRIAIEIHDQLGQILTAALLNLRMLERDGRQLDEDSVSQIRDVEALLDEAYLGMKSIATSLHPAVLKFGLATAIEWLADRILKPAGIGWRIEAPEQMPVLEPRLSMALFRIVQESFTNVARHADASAVRVSFASGKDGLRLEIIDNGKGFDAGTIDGGQHFGLAGIRLRAESLGAHAAIESAPGRGTRIRIAVPSVGAGAPSVGT